MQHTLGNTLAGFDGDGTIFRGSLLISLVEELIRTGIFPQTARDEYAREHDDWRCRHGAYDAYIQAVVATFLRHIVGKKHVYVQRAAEEVVAKEREWTYTYTRDLILQLRKDMRYTLVLLSHSPLTIVIPFARVWGFQYCMGTDYKHQNGVYTGERLLYSKDRMLELLRQHHRFTMKGAIFVGDTEADIPIMEEVARSGGRPICFNPNQSLWKKAKENSWEVYVERKDMVYPL